MAGLQTRAATTEIIDMSARELAARLRTGQLAARELVEAHIHRIEAVNPVLNALVATRFDEALQEAAALDAARARGTLRGHLHGVPFTVKDQFDAAGMPTGFGVPSRRGHRAERDGPLVARLRQAGGVLLGKGNVPQLLLYGETDNPLYGRTNNPWNLERSTGGGSGGDAATVATRGAPLSLVADIGGSIRMPAHFCGIYGLKPTSHRLTNLDTPSKFFLPGQEAIRLESGPFARSVGDLALAMEVLAAPGLEAIDVSVPPVPWRDPAAVAVRGLRVALYDDDGFFPAAPAVRRATREAGAALAARGAQVEEFTPPDAAEGMAIYFGLLAAAGANWVKRALGHDRRDQRTQALIATAGVPNGLLPALTRLAQLAGQERLAETLRTVRSLSADEYWQMIERRNGYRARFLAALGAERFDVIICPANALPGLRHGATKYLATAASYSWVINILDIPSGTVPATRVRPGEESDRPESRDVVERAARETEEGSAGLPVGVQVSGRPWREDMVLAVMAALEEHFRGQPDYPDRPPL